MPNEIVITSAQLREERMFTERRAEPLTGLRTRDMAGNKLVDVVNPKTGFVSHVRSALESAANNTPHDPKPGISVSQKDVDELPHLDPETGLWWVGGNRLVQRTIDTPEGPLKVARVVKPSVAEKLDRRAAAASKVTRAPKSVSTEKREGARKPETRAQRQGMTGDGNNVTSAEITEYVRRKYGYTGKLTSEIRRAARVAIETERQVRSACDGPIDRDLAARNRKIIASGKKRQAGNK